MSEEKGVEALRAENDALRKRMEKLEEQVNPKPRPEWVHQPPDYTAGMSMPANALAAMVDCSKSFMADLRADARKPNPIQASQSPITSTPSTQSPQPQRQGGWVEPRPLEPPPGVAIADQLTDAQDEIDRVELAQKLAKARMGKGDVK